MTWLRAACAVWLLSEYQVSATAPAENGTCGMCLVEKCPLEIYHHESLTWYESNCLDYIHDRDRVCIDYIHHMQGSPEIEEEEEHKVPYVIITIFSSFALGAVIRYIFQDTPIPYTVILFLAGVAWGALSDAWWAFDASAELSEINPHLIFHVFLPVLIFESAFAMEIPIFKKVMAHCVLLAGPGLLIASTLTAMVAKYVFTEYEWNWYACLLFGTILSATDPVAVVALLKELGASPVVSTLIEGESLFNDGTAIVIFSLLVEAIQKDSCAVVDWDTCVEDCVCDELAHPDCALDKTVGEIVLKLVKVALGGPVVGLLIGMASVALLNRVFNDALIEITMTFVTAYITFFVCEVFFEVSGVLGVVAAGCFMSYYRHSISPEVMHTLHEFWEITVYLTNTLIFILAGMIVYIKAFDNFEPVDFLYLLIIYVTINVVRGIVLVMMLPFFHFLECKISTGNLVLVAWGGLRGAVGLALALSIQADEEVAIASVREKFIFHVAGIVVLTLCINGTTTQNVVKYFELNKIEERRRKRMHDVWKKLLIEQAEDLRHIRAQPSFYDTNWERVGKYADIRGGLGERLEDPYNPIGWYHKRNFDSTDEQIELKNRSEGHTVYLSSISASLNKQYYLGTLRRQGIRHMQRDIVRSREAGTEAVLERDDWTSKVLIQVTAVKELFERSSLEKTLSSTAKSVDEWLLRWRWQNGFDVALAFIKAHQDTRARVHPICERNVANQIDTHCKRTNIGIVKVLTAAADSRPDISCSLKTRSACRNILNSMTLEVKKMKHDARLDDQDATAIMDIIKSSQRKVQMRFERSVEHSSAAEVVESLPWFINSGRQTRMAIHSELRSDRCVVEVPAGTNLLAALDEDVGLLIPIVGIIQIRVGRKMFLYGSGYTAGWQALLTGHDRFSNLWAESWCKVIHLRKSLLAPLLKQDEQFATFAWKACGINATRFLMSIDDAYDPKVWDDRTIRKLAEKGDVVMLQDAEGYDIHHQRRHKLEEGFHRCLLRGRAWEYGEERDHLGGNLCQYPTLIPSEFKFATFTGHAVIFEMLQETSASLRAKLRWGRMRSKIKSIYLWSHLRGPHWGKVCLALAFKREPPDHRENGAKSNPTQQSSSSTKEQPLQSLGGSLEDEIPLNSDSTGKHDSDTPAQANTSTMFTRPNPAARTGSLFGEVQRPNLKLQPVTSPLLQRQLDMQRQISPFTPSGVNATPLFGTEPSFNSRHLSNSNVAGSGKTWTNPLTPGAPGVKGASRVAPPSHRPSPASPGVKQGPNLVLPPAPDFRKILHDISEEEKSPSKQASPLEKSNRNAPPTFADLLGTVTSDVNSKSKKNNKADLPTAFDSLLSLDAENGNGRRLSL